MDIQSLSKSFGVNVESGKEYPVFLQNTKGKNILLLFDENTYPLSVGLLGYLEKNDRSYGVLRFDEKEPIADEKTVNRAVEEGKGYDYLLAVGSGTLNDIAKRAGFLLGKPSGVFATAPSMDGYTSGVTPLIENQFKITRNAQVASDILIDYDILNAAPRMMIGAGVGDILAKYCCLTDWRVSRELTGEQYNDEAANLMYEAVKACDKSIPDLIAEKEDAAEKLMEALIISGYAMVIAGNSRPASGAEHHMSHFLEMDFLKRGERIPLHGIKVGLGTAVSLWLYHNVKNCPSFEGKDYVTQEAEKLPSPKYVLDILGSLSCPVRFSQLGISRETMKEMLFEAYKIRDRFTILTLYCTKGFMNEFADEIVEKFY